MSELPKIEARYRRFHRARRRSGLSRRALHQRIFPRGAAVAGDELAAWRAALADPEIVAEIARALGVSPRWLTTGEVSESSRRAIAEVASLPNFHRLRFEDRRGLVETIEMLPGADEIEKPPQPRHHD